MNEAQLLTYIENYVEVNVWLPTVTEMVNVDKLITLPVSTVNTPLVVIDTPLTAVLLSVYEVELITQSVFVDVATPLITGKV